jgi:glycosyltransferase involved in cell wall biosynthesis
MVGPAPPTIGGMVSVIDTLITGPLRDRFAMLRFPTCEQPQRRPKGPFGLIRSVKRHVAGLASLGHAIVVNRINMLHIHTCSDFSFYRSLADLLVGRLLGRRVILHVHGAQFDRFCINSGWIGRSAIRRGCELADAVVVLSQGWRDRLSPFAGRARWEVVPNGVNIPRSSENHDSPAEPLQAEAVPCRFIFVGALIPRKGVRELLEAAVWLRDRGNVFELVIAGPPAETGPDWAEHVRLVGLESQVTFVGPVAGPGKAALFDSADCLVLPSHAEGLPIVVLEAAARGLPCIATDVGSTAELLTMVEADGTTREISPLVPAGDAVALGEAMARLLVDAPLRHEMGAALREHVSRNFSSAVQSARLARLYESLLPECASHAASNVMQASVVVRPPTDHRAKPVPAPRQKTPQTTVCP